MSLRIALSGVILAAIAAMGGHAAAATADADPAADGLGDRVASAVASPSAGDHPPTRVLLAIDATTSRTGDVKAQAAITIGQAVLDALPDSVEVSVVTYDDRTHRLSIAPDRLPSQAEIEDPEACRLFHEQHPGIWYVNKDCQIDVGRYPRPKILVKQDGEDVRISDFLGRTAELVNDTETDVPLRAINAAERGGGIIEASTSLPVLISLVPSIIDALLSESGIDSIADSLL